MKEIRVYIGKCCVGRALAALDKAGAPAITAVDVHLVGYRYESDDSESQVPDALRRYGSLPIVKLEIVCVDQDLERLLETVQRVCRVGERGDGWIFVTDLERGIHLEDGASGDEALAHTWERGGPGDSYLELPGEQAQVEVACVENSTKRRELS